MLYGLEAPEAQAFSGFKAHFHHSKVRWKELRDDELGPSLERASGGALLRLAWALSSMNEATQRKTLLVYYIVIILDRFRLYGLLKCHLAAQNVPHRLCPRSCWRILGAFPGLAIGRTAFRAVGSELRGGYGLRQLQEVALHHQIQAPEVPLRLFSLHKLVALGDSESSHRGGLQL